MTNTYNNLKSLRKLAGMTQRDAAKACGISLSTYTSYEKSCVKMNKIHLKRLWEVFGHLGHVYYTVNTVARKEKIEKAKKDSMSYYIRILNDLGMVVMDREVFNTMKAAQDTLKKINKLAS